MVAASGGPIAKPGKDAGKNEKRQKSKKEKKKKMAVVKLNEIARWPT